MDCPDCGGHLKQKVTEGQGANRTKNRLVGGRNMSVARQCTRCGKHWDASDLTGHED